VSRKHIVITVEPLELEFAYQLITKSRLTVEDCSSQGSLLDGKKLPNKPPTALTKDTHHLQLGNWAHKLRISWVPICLAVTHFNKAKEDSIRKFNELREKLAPFDIKATPDINHAHTTHVVVSKRNVASTLEGLAHGSFVVTSAFIQAIIDVATQVPVPGTDMSKAPLEVDYTALWPNEIDFVPPAGKEPSPRPAETYAPKLERQTVFRGYTFIFCLQNQMDNLQAPITTGGGKAKLYEEFKIGLTKPKDFVAYVKRVAGETGAGELSNTGPGVVVVRISGDDAWAQDFVQKTDLLLGQRSILQNEFLDPILMTDASVMRQALQEEDEPTFLVAPSQSDTNINGMVPSTAPEAGEKISARARRLQLGRVRSKFTGFDDFEEKPLSSIPIIEEKHREDITMQDSRAIAPNNRSGGLSPSQEMAPRRKRGIGQSGLDEILPTAAEVKRRRIVAGIEDTSQTPAPAPLVKKEQVKEQAKLFNRKTIKKSNALADEPVEGIDKDLRDAVSAKRELDEREMESKREKEQLEKPLTAEELEAIRNQIQIGEMPVRQSRKGDKQRHAADDRWDDRWNGRQNYKRFRRKGEGGDQPLRANRVIVTLELASTNETSLGSVRWATTTTNKRGKKARLSQFDSVDQEDQNHSFGRQPTVAETEYQLAMLEVLSDPEEGIEVSKDLGHVPKRRVAGSDSDDDSDGDVVITGATTTQADSIVGSSRPNKRPADGSMAAPPPPKRAAIRRLHVSDEEDNSSDESEDDMRFKFRSRTKKK
jgi:hypothetical protein